MARITIDGRTIDATEGISVAAALWNAGRADLRPSVAGDRRGALCAMGVCFECRLRIDGHDHQRACMTMVRDGMTIETGGAER